MSEFTEMTIRIILLIIGFVLIGLSLGWIAGCGALCIAIAAS